MGRKEAVNVIYEIINSDIINEELEDKLNEIANCIEDDSFKDFISDEEVD